MNELATTNKGNDAFTRILGFLMREDIVLSAEEEKILDRWNYADALLAQRRLKHGQIADKIRERFGVSKYTAQDDITQAYALFGQTRVLNKQYLLYHHIEDINRQIEEARLDKSQIALLPKLFDARTKALAQLGDDAGKKRSERPVVFIGTIQQQTPTHSTSFQEAMEQLRKRKESNNVEDIDHEDIA